MVYTPVPSIMSGGHFLTYDTMHLSEMAVSFDLGLDSHEPRHHVTNAVHPGMLRKVYRMAIALPHIVETRGMSITYFFTNH